MAVVLYPIVSLVVALLCLFPFATGNAGITCCQCHGAKSPVDYRPVDAPYRNMTTGGFVGKHRTHMGASAPPASCAVCHPGSAGYATSHRDGWIKISSRANNSPLVTRYNNSTSAFPQTATPITGSCANVNCHFEKTTPAWGTTSLYQFPGDCLGACHGSPPNGGDNGADGSHTAHNTFFPGLNNCSKCHPNHTVTPYFGHATSAANRGVVVKPSDPVYGPFGQYTGNTRDFLPSQTNKFSVCNNFYCHSTVQGLTDPTQPPSTLYAPTWGGQPFASICGETQGCHGVAWAHPDDANSSSLQGRWKSLASGSHAKHIKYRFNEVGNCQACHFNFSNTGDAGCSSCHAGHGSFIHIGHNITVAFNPDNILFSEGTGGYSGDSIPGTPYGSCSGFYCHSDGTAISTGVLNHYTSIKWGSGALNCMACHGNPPAYSNGIPKANSHDAHNSYSCNNCHYSTTTDGASITTSRYHVNRAYNVTVGVGISFAYSFATSGGTCGNISCHFGGTATWGGTVACGACHAVTSQTLTTGGHPAHLSAVRGPNGVTTTIDCDTCHGAGASLGAHDGHGNGVVSFADGNTLAATTACNNCHSPGGAYDGVNDAAIGAINNWPLGVYDGTALKTGKESWCLGCHDSAPAVISGQTATNKAGNGATYGYNITGHGRNSSFSRMSWQDTTASGNPAAGRGCIDCHDSARSHINTGASNSRLKAGYENQNNANCYQCHKTGMADNAPVFYTTSSAYKSSAHNGKLCTECHDVHGSTGAYTAMTKWDKQTLCSQCHSNGGHPGVGSKEFTVGGKNYTLQCTSCHNVHVITGTYAQADQNKSPVSRFLDNTHVWGATAGEKMNAYAGSGAYRTPNGEAFSGSQLPDYATFCLDCHGTSSSGSVFFGINWDGDSHGKVSANQPNGYGACPNWFACGKATGWDGDDCLGGAGEFVGSCWPVIPRGAGDQLFSRDPYTHTERVAGANFVLSCTDCHTGHGTGTLGRPNVNGGSFTSNWNNMCNRCHYYYSDWHAGMSCGNASCHVSSRMSSTGTSTPHSMANGNGSGGTRTHQAGLVIHYAFESNLKDSSGWELDGKWYSASGSFAAGKTGQAAVLGNGQTVQVGTENSNWSTDEGYHGTWKYTEMKYNTTLESWVYPTDSAKSEYTIFNKHVGISNGGYSFSLRKIGGYLRATFNMQADNNADAQGGAAGIRGAYSSIAIPLNKWTHVSATFDMGGPDRNPSDPSAGRIRIYVNGVDVTTSDSSGNNMQPDTNETSIYAYSENSPWNQSICYNGQWCASEFSIGGFDWESTNFIGSMDDAKVWNVTKNSGYFSSYQAQAGPYISSVEGLVGSNQLTVIFSEGVYTNTGSSGVLVPADFVLTDTGGNNPRTITGVTHTAGSTTATITMSAPLTVADINSDTLAAATNAIYDKDNMAAGTETVTVGLSSQCPVSPITLQLNEASGSAYVMDTQNILYGAVYGGAATLTGSAYSGGGDGSGRYLDFPYNSACLQADRKMTIETRINPSGISGTTNYVRRILARDGNGNFQISLWRNDSVSDQDPPSDVVTVALWVKPVDPNPYPATVWKGILTDFNACPIVNDHWYLVKVVWDSDATGIPIRIYVDDQGTDGNGAGENWTDYVDCTDSDQSQMPTDKRVKEGDSLPKAAEAFKIGANLTTPTNNLFNGLIDWIIWKDTAE